MLREESGLEQVAGGPYKRGRWSYMNHPDDPGGATMMGVTHGVYDAWRAKQGLEPRDVRQVEDAEIEAIYRGNYWDPIRGDELPVGLDMAVYDFAVNSGPSRATKELQACLGVPVDGHLGDVTIAAANAAEIKPLIYDYMDRRRRFCRSLRNYPSFKNGWETRWGRIEEKSRALADGQLIYAPPSLSMIGLVGGGGANSAPTEGDMPTGGRAVEAAPRASMAQSTTGNAAAIVTTGGLAALGMDASSALQKVIVTVPVTRGAVVFGGSWMLELMTRGSFWMAIFTAVVPGAYIWFERKRKMLLEGAAK